MNLYRVELRSFKKEFLGLGMEMNRWLNLGIISVFKTVIFPIGVKYRCFHLVNVFIVFV